MLRSCTIFLVLFISARMAWGHPVSFQGSKGAMGSHTPMMSHVQLNYSFKYWFAVGAHYYVVASNQGNYNASFLSANFLIKRWNGAFYQANIYGVVGAGYSKFRGESEGAGFAKLQFDIEGRNYYFLTSYSQLQTEKVSDLKDMVVRAGLAPYVANYDDIHAWLILEWRSINIAEQGFTDDVTPFLRLFYKNLLFEIGQSFSGTTRFNYIVHF